MRSARKRRSSGMKVAALAAALLALALGPSPKALAQVSITLDPSEIQSTDLNGATIDITPVNSTFIGSYLGVEAGGDAPSALGTEYADGFDQGTRISGYKFIFSPDGSFGSSTASDEGGLSYAKSQFTLDGAPMGLTIHDVELLAPVENTGNNFANAGISFTGYRHRSVRITLAYSGGTITADTSVRVSVDGKMLISLDNPAVPDGPASQQCDSPPVTRCTAFRSAFTIKAPVTGAAVITAQSADTTVNDSNASDTSTFTVKLNEQPSARVTVTVTAPNGLELDGPDSATTFTTSEDLIFTSSGGNRWSRERTITVRATPDNVDNSPGRRSLDVTYAATSNDNNYSGLSGTAATVTVVDGDPTTVTLAGLAGDIMEAAGQKNLTLTLGRALVAGETLTVPVASTGAARKGLDFLMRCPAANSLPAGVSCTRFRGRRERLQPLGVTFTGPSAESVTFPLVAKTDTTVEPGGETVVIGLGDLTATGLDGGATGVDNLEDFKITEAATAGVNADEGLDASVTEGDTADTGRFTVALHTRPSSNVTVTVTAPAGLELDGPDSATAFGTSEDLTFTTANWDDDQVVIVRATNDNVDSPSQRELDVTYSTSSSDSDYSGLAGTAATITVIDNDPTTVTLAGDAGDVEEGNTKTFTVTLSRSLEVGEGVEVPLTFAGTATRGTDYNTACPNPLPTGVTCADLNNVGAGNNPRVTFEDAGADSVTLTLTAETDSDAESGGETVQIGLGTLRASSGADLDGGASGTDSLADFSITDPAPANAPDAPADLTATAGDAQVTLNWTNPSDSNITEYEYQQRTGGGAWGGWTDFASGATTTTHTVTGLTNGTEYGFRIRAVSAGGNSDASASATATPLATNALDAPTALTAMAGAASVTLSWTAPSGTITKYQVRSGSGDPLVWGSWTDIADSASLTSHTVTGLTVGTEYSFQVRAVSGTGGSTVLGTMSATASATPVAATVGFKDALLTLDEDEGPLTVTLALSNTVSADVDVYFISTALTAIKGTDFAAGAVTSPDSTTGTYKVTITAGQTEGSTTIAITNDTIAEGNELFFMTIHEIASTVAIGRASDRSTRSDVIIRDDGDTAVKLPDPATLTVTEASGGTRTATYDVALLLPVIGTETVTVAVASRDASVATAAPASLTFDADDWSTGKTVTVTGVDDAIDQNPDRTVAIRHTATSDVATSAYKDRDPADLTVTVTDDDPTVVQITGVPDKIKDTTAFTATFTFSAGVTGFDTNDVTVTGGTKGAFGGSGDEYTLAITPTSGSNVVVTVAANSATAGTDQAPASAQSATATWDAAAPTVSITGIPDKIKTTTALTATLPSRPPSPSPRT